MGVHGTKMHSWHVFFFSCYLYFCSCKKERIMSSRFTLTASGPRGPDGLGGSTGPMGQKGPIGEVGAAGGPGVAGETGYTGAPGMSGLAGAPGQMGPRGPKGDTGPKGLSGPLGVKGPPGNPPGLYLPLNGGSLVGTTYIRQPHYYVTAQSVVQIGVNECVALNIWDNVQSYLGVSYSAGSFRIEVSGIYIISVQIVASPLFGTLATNDLNANLLKYSSSSYTSLMVLYFQNLGIGTTQIANCTWLGKLSQGDQVSLWAANFNPDNQASIQPMLYGTQLYTVNGSPPPFNSNLAVAGISFQMIA